MYKIYTEGLFRSIHEYQMNPARKQIARRGMYVDRIEALLLDAINRFVHWLNTPEDILILAPKEDVRHLKIT